MHSGPFNPLELTAQASLNDVEIQDPALPHPQPVPAEKLCSRDALHILTQLYGLARVRAHRIADDLNGASYGDDANIARSANQLLRRYGHRLGALIVTLRDPATAARQAKSPLHHAYLTHWTTVDSIALAGGLLAGHSGRIIAEAASSLAQTAILPCAVELSPYAPLAPLIGLILRHSPTAHGAAVAVADLGHTSIKPAVAIHDGAQLQTLHKLQPLPAPADAPADQIVHAVASALSSAVLATSSFHGFTGKVLVSIAAPVHRGVPAGHGLGTYSCLADRIADIKRRIGLATGIAVTLEFVHDATAAAAAATHVNSATICAGTWLGAGFLPPGAPPRLRLAPLFQVTTQSCRHTPTPSPGHPLANTPDIPSILRMSNVDRYWG